MSKYTLECSSKTFQNMKFTGSFHFRQIMCRPLSKIADWGPFSQLFAAGPEEMETLIWVQAKLSSVVTFLPWMNVDTQYFLVFTSPLSDFGSMTFLADVTNSHALWHWHISCCINLTMHRKSWGPVLCIVRMSTVTSYLGNDILGNIYDKVYVPSKYSQNTFTPVCCHVCSVGASCVRTVTSGFWTLQTTASSWLTRISPAQTFLPQFLHSSST